MQFVQFHKRFLITCQDCLLPEGSLLVSFTTHDKFTNIQTLNVISVKNPSLIDSFAKLRRAYVNRYGSIMHPDASVSKHYSALFNEAPLFTNGSECDMAVTMYDHRPASNNDRMGGGVDRKEKFEDDGGRYRTYMPDEVSLQQFKEMWYRVFHSDFDKFQPDLDCDWPEDGTGPKENAE